MTPVLATRRLLLRPIVPDDAPAIARGMSNWDVVQWLTAPPFPYALTDAHHFIDEIVPDTTTWAIDAGEGLIGVIGVKPDLGYWLDAEYHGQRIMSEAAEAVVAWYFEGRDDDLVSGHFVGNGVSQRVLRKLGFAETALEDVLQTATQENVKLQRMILTRQAWENRNG